MSKDKSEAEKLHDDYEEKKKPIEDEYKRKLSELQARCPHTVLTDWMDVWWAMGHSTGYNVQHCKNCDKEIHRRTCCYVCGRTIQDDAIKQFTPEMLKKRRENGQTSTLAINGAYCADCFSGHPPASAKKRFEEMTSWPIAADRLARKL